MMKVSVVYVQHTPTTKLQHGLQMSHHTTEQKPDLLSLALLSQVGIFTPS